MRIGELAERAGTTTRTLRYYESRGLLPARRAVNGYRTYDEDDLRLLQQIRTLQDFGFDLEETRPFVECLRAGHPAGDSCPASLAVYRRQARRTGHAHRAAPVGARPGRARNCARGARRSAQAKRMSRAALIRAVS